MSGMNESVDGMSGTNESMGVPPDWWRDRNKSGRSTIYFIFNFYCKMFLICEHLCCKEHIKSDLQLKFNWTWDHNQRYNVSFNW
jgi:hypothetical protein